MVDDPIGTMRIRDAGLGDVGVAAEFLLAMVGEMAACGGHAVAEGDASLAWFRNRIAATLDEPHHLLLLAETGDQEAEVLGAVEASITRLEPVFDSRRVLHIHAVFVRPAHRRQGIGRQLVGAALAWGRQHGCAEAELNALVGNPARRLYESEGFAPVEVSMRRRL